MRSVKIVLSALICAVLWGGMARAETRSPVVVELYTSQGCYSCPPADELLHKMSSHEGVIPLALHVDYWDYIGWKDSFANPAFSARQREYARIGGRRAVYTPQMIIGGVDAVVGNRPMDVAEIVRQHALKPDAVALTLARDGGTLRISATPNGQVGPSEITLVRYIPEATVEIRRGENAGKTLTYSNIVSDWQTVARWDGNAAFALDVQVDGADPVVVIVQRKGQREILAAGRLR